MAKEAKAETKAEVKAEEKVKAPEEVYDAKDLAENAEVLFSTRPECVTAALKAADIVTCTVEKARTIVREFLSKEVK